LRKLHVINVGKHNPGYKDRKSIWLKYHFSARNDHGFSRLCETDKWRFLEFIRLEIQTKEPVILEIGYLTMQGFDLKSRRLESTIRQLSESKLVEIGEGTEWEQKWNRIGTEQEQDRNREGTEQEQKTKIVTTKRVKKKSVTQSREEKSREEKITTIKKVSDNPPAKEEVILYSKGKGFVSEVAQKGKKMVPMINWKQTLGQWNKNRQDQLPPNHPDSNRVSL